MNPNSKGGCIAAFLALFAVAMCGTAAAAKMRVDRHRAVHHSMHRPAPHGHFRASPEGDLIDQNGWRLRNGVWDNTCFNLAYLPSQFACSSNGGGTW
jgi:hypothetical protein